MEVFVKEAKNAPGIRRVVPYTSSAVQAPMSSLRAVRTPSRMRGSDSTQLADKSVRRDDFSCR